MTNLALCDSHAHLSYVVEKKDSSFLSDITKVYKNTDSIILDIGVDYDDFPHRIAKFGHLNFVNFSAGIWPDARPHVAPSVEERLTVLEEHVKNPLCKIVGECGLDYHWMNGSAEEQAELFLGQIELALKYNKGLIVHSRDAHADTLSMVKNAASHIPVLIHCFSYDEQAAKQYIDAGCYVSFAGNLTYKKNEALRAALAIVPYNKLLLETDAPYMNPMPLRGQDSTPLDIERTYLAASAILGTSIETLNAIVLKNLRLVLKA